MLRWNFTAVFSNQTWAELDEKSGTWAKQKSFCLCCRLSLEVACVCKPHRKISKKILPCLRCTANILSLLTQQPVLVYISILIDQAYNKWKKLASPCVSTTMSESLNLVDWKTNCMENQEIFYLWWFTLQKSICGWKCVPFKLLTLDLLE